MTVRRPPFVHFEVPTHGTLPAHYFVLHTTEGGGTIESLAQFFRSNSLGVTFILEPNGRVGFNGALDAITWHVQMHNSECRGMEQIGFTKTPRAQWLTTFKPQIYMAAWVLAWASEQMGFPLIAAGSDAGGRHFLHSKGVTQHKWVPDNDHDDCGSGYPFDEVMRLAARWKQSGGPSRMTRLYLALKRR